MTNLDTSSIHAAIDDRLESIRKGIEALAAANEGVVAAIRSEAPISADGVGSLFDILLEDLKSHTEGIHEILAETTL